MITYNRILAAGLLMGSSVAAMADGTFSLSKIDLAPGETRTVTVSLKNDSAISQFQVDIVLPTGLEFVQNSFVKSDNVLNDIMAAKQGGDASHWRVASINMSGEPILASGSCAEPTALFTFEVKANNEWTNGGHGDVANSQDTIKITEAALSTPLGNEEDVLDVNGSVAPLGKGTLATSVAGKMVIKASDIKLTLNGDELTEDDMELRPTQDTKKITVNLWSHGETARTWMDNPGDSVSKISLVQGVITLPKGVYYVNNSGKVNVERTKTAAGTNAGVNVFNQTFNADGTATVKFMVGRYAGGLRLLDGELFTFEVAGGDPFDATHVYDQDGKPGYDIQAGDIKIDNITMTVSSGAAGIQVFPDEVLTVHVTNPNQVEWDETYPSKLSDLRDSLETNKGKVNQNATDFPKTAAQIQAAEAAVEAYEGAVKSAYAEGTLAEFDDSQELEKAAYNEIGDILQAYYDEYEEGQAAIYNRFKDTLLRELTPAEQPYRNYPGITGINDPVSGSFIQARNALTSAYEAVAGTPEILGLDLAPMAHAVDSIVAVFEDSVAKAKALYDAELIEYTGTQTAKLDPEVAPADKQYYPGVVAITSANGTFAAAKQAAKDKWEAAVNAGTAYDVDFTDDIAALAAVQAAYEKALADADSAKTKHEAIFQEYIQKTLPALQGDTLDWSRKYDKLTQINAVPDGEFDNAMKALEEKHAQAVAANQLVNDDFAKETAVIDSLLAAYDAAIDEALSNARTNLGKYDEAVEAYDSLKLQWPVEPEEIGESNGIPGKLAFFQERTKALKEQVQKLKDRGEIADMPCKFSTQIEKLANAFNDLQDAINESSERYNKLDSILGSDLKDFATSLTDEGNSAIESELEKAKVVDPSKVEGQPNAVQTLSQDAYEQLKETLGSKSPALEEEVEEWKDNFLTGEWTKEQLDSALAEYEGKKEAILDEAEKLIVKYLVKYQRGDVGGDGRWTTNDYARIRRMILDAAEPTITSWKKTGTGIYAEVEIEAEDSKDAYTFARYDVNRDGQINVGDAQAALNYTFYGDEFNHDATYQEARSMESTAESVTATVRGNVIAVALQNGRRYSAFQMDVVLPEGMAVASETTGLRNEGFTLSSSDVNGVHRILVTSAQGRAFEGSEGDVLYLEVTGSGSVEFRNVIFADVNAATAEFQVEAVATGEATGISGVKAQNGVMDAIYSVGGRMMDGLRKGINIIRRADGDTKKVIK